MAFKTSIYDAGFISHERVQKSRYTDLGPKRKYMLNYETLQQNKKSQIDMLNLQEENALKNLEFSEDKLDLNFDNAIKQFEIQKDKVGLRYDQSVDDIEFKKEASQFSQEQMALTLQNLNRQVETTGKLLGYTKQQKQIAEEALKVILNQSLVKEDSLRNQEALQKFQF